MRIKLLTILSIIFFLNNITLAQSVGEYRVRKTETVTKKIEKQKKPKVEREKNPEREGFFVMPEVEISPSNYEIININGIIGYEFNNHIALGVGMGLATSFYSWNIPLFTNIHGDITKKEIFNKITPYYSIDFGYNMNIVDGYRDNYTKGVLLAPEIGIRIKDHCYIGIISMFFTQCYDYKWSYYSGHYPYLDRDFGLSKASLKFGYKIPLKNVKF